MVSVLAPLAYVAFLVGSLVIFSKVYRRRQAVKGSSEPWFGPHHSRDLYFSLLSMDPPPARPVLVAALIRRAMTDVQRIMEIRENKNALQNLLTKGQIGDDTWNDILEAEKELDSEIYEVVQEANTFKQGWGQFIFAHAGDEVQHEKNKKWWEELEGEKQRLAEKYSSPAPLITPPPLLGISASNPKKRVLPSSTPANASNAGGSSSSAPTSKPGTPVPQRVMSNTPGSPAGAPGTPGQGGQVGQGGGQQMTPVQMQQAAMMQLAAAIRQQNPQLTPQQAAGAAMQMIQQQQAQQQAQLQAQAAAQAGAGGAANGISNGTGTPAGTPAGTPSKSSAVSRTSTSTPPKTPAAMLRQASTMSTVSSSAGGSSIGGDSDAEDDDAESNGTSPAGSAGVASPRKTPNKKGKKKGKGKKK